MHLNYWQMILALFPAMVAIRIATHPIDYLPKKVHASILALILIYVIPAMLVAWSLHLFGV